MARRRARAMPPKPPSQALQIKAKKVMTGVADAMQAKSKRDDGKSVEEKKLQAEFDEIKALTMHNMIEPVLGGKKLLFLTGEQADLLAGNPSSLDKMMLEFGIKRPQLVINLLESGGFRDWTCQASQDV